MVKKSNSKGLSIFLIGLLSGCIVGQNNFSTTRMDQLTHTLKGHTLHHNGVFSSDGRWIVFDGRNEDTKIGETTEIAVLNLQTKKETIIYKTTAPTIYGPGVGAASFNPKNNTVVFIHGLPNADKKSPYGLTRRTGVAVDMERPQQPVFLDARDITAPYAPGSLRGGTHSHCWSPDGKLLSFTYNDALIAPDLRTVGVMFKTQHPVLVDEAGGNNNGIYYAAIVADVKTNPKPGSDEIGKAFDECWVGEEGTINPTGNRAPYTIAFQGNTINKKGKVITEIFVVDIDTTLILADKQTVGTEGTRPQVPKGIQQRRITYSDKGLSQVRHWLRSDKEGKYIYALADDDKGLAQLIQCDLQTGNCKFLTENAFSIEFPFNLDTSGTRVAFIGDNNVFLFDRVANKMTQLSSNRPNGPRVVGAPSFSPDGKTLVFNQYVKAGGTSFLQVMAISVADL